MIIKFISLNLWQGGNLLDKIIKFFRKEKPDIIALQEVYNGNDQILPKNFQSIKILKHNLKGYYLSFSPTFLEVKKFGRINQGNAISSKYPIVSGKTIFYDIPYGKRYEDRVEDYPFNPRNLQHTTIRINNKDLNVFNTQGIWGLDGGDNERRLKMSETIVNEIRDKQNVILAGDFNLRQNTQTIYNIEKYVKNVFKDELKTTFNMKRKTNPDYAKVVVDMIFVNKSIEVVNHYCPQVDISDHLPLVCILEIK